MTYLERGSKVLTAEETQRIIDAGNIEGVTINNKHSADEIGKFMIDMEGSRITNTLKSGFRNLEETIKNKQEVHFDYMAIENRVKRGSSWIKFLNQNYK